MPNKINMEELLILEFFKKTIILCGLAGYKKNITVHFNLIRAM